MLIELSKIEANPNRDLINNPINRFSSRYKKLKDSIEETGYWGIIQVRRHPEVNDKYQLVFGHHRFAILKDIGLKEAEFVLAENLHDIDMYKRMLLENLNYSKVDINDALEAYFGFINQIKSAYIDAGQDISLLPNIIRNNFNMENSIFSDFDEVIEREIKSLMNGEEWSDIASNYIKDIYGKKVFSIIRLIVKENIPLEDIDQSKSLTEILNILKNKRENIVYKNKDSEILEIINTAARSVGAFDSSQIPKKIKEEYVKNVHNGQMSIQQLHNTVRKFISKLQENIDDKDYSKPGYIYILMMTDSAGKSFIKVGFTNRAVEQRRRELDVGPFEITEHMRVRVSNGLMFEQTIHKSHHNDQVRNNREWYNYSSLKVMEDHLLEIEAKCDEKSNCLSI